MKSGIIGPNCTDPEICHSDCCSIFIDVPKKLAFELIKNGLANENDFIRSNVFSFVLKIDENTGKCTFFDKKINGCSLHFTGLKPPSCWIYPTNFDNIEDQNIKCKSATGWKITDSKAVKNAEIILKEYISWSKDEFADEMRLINSRIENYFYGKSLNERLMLYKPSEFAGFKDSWNNFNVLMAEGISLQLKKYCSKFNPSCKLFPDNFLECNKICASVADGIIKFFLEIIEDYLDQYGPDSGEYPLIKISEFIKEGARRD